MTNKEKEKPIVKCPNCQEDVTYYFERGIKEGKSQTLVEVKEKISNFFGWLILNYEHKTKEGVLDELQELLSQIDDNSQDKIGLSSSEQRKKRKPIHGQQVSSPDNISKEKPLCKNCGKTEEEHSKYKYCSDFVFTKYEEAK